MGANEVVLTGFSQSVFSSDLYISQKALFAESCGGNLVAFANTIHCYCKMRPRGYKRSCVILHLLKTPEEHDGHSSII